MSPASHWNDIEHVKNTAAELASGNTCTDIAISEGVTHSAVSKFKKKHADLIKQYSEQYLSVVPDIVNRDTKEIQQAQSHTDKLNTLLTTYDPDNDKEIQALQKHVERIDKKTDRVLQSIGIRPSHAPAIAFQQFNIYNDNRQTISNTVLNALTNNARQSTDLPDDIVIDADITNDDV